MFPVHARVLPLDGQRPPIGSPVQGANDILEGHMPSPQASKIPVPFSVAEGQMPAEHT